LKVRTFHVRTFYLRTFNTESGIMTPIFVERRADAVGVRRFFTAPGHQ